MLTVERRTPNMIAIHSWVRGNSATPLWSYCLIPTLPPEQPQDRPLARLGIPRRLRDNAPLNAPRPELFYGEGPEDEPFLYDQTQPGKFLIGAVALAAFGAPALVMPFAAGHRAFPWPSK